MKLDEATRRRLKQKITFLLEFGDEQDIIDWAKKWNPNITLDQEKRVAKLFLDEKRGPGHSR